MMNPQELKTLYTDCTLCPRKCHVNRYERAGFCGAGTNVKIARAALHMWEEPALGGHPDTENQPGSGTIFFSHCTLKCIFCQNYDISSDGFGREITISRLADIMLELEQQGAANIDLVTPTHYVPSIIAALDLVKHKLSIPVVFNCGGYENVETLRLLDGYIDIYLPDLKYYENALSTKYSAASDYFETALRAIEEMIRQTGAPQYSAQDSERLLRGVIIRHMVLPNCRKDSIKMLETMTQHLQEKGITTDQYLISLMSQYTPFFKADSYPEINRRITSFEYGSVVNRAIELGLDGFLQEKSSAKEEYTPSFDLTGV